MTTAQMEMDTGVTGAKRQSWHRANPRDVLKRLIEKNLEMGEEELALECWEIVHQNAEQMRTIFEYWFANNYRSLVKKAAAPADGPVSTKQRAARENAAASAAALRTKLDEMVEDKVKIALLDMVMPSGKLLRHSTREEIIECGGWMQQRLAARLQPGQTPEEATLTEDELRQMYVEDTLE